MRDSIPGSGDAGETKVGGDDAKGDLSKRCDRDAKPSTARPERPVRVFIDLTNQSIDLQPMRDFLFDPDTGAHAWFEGVTRRTTGNRETLELTYEAFEPMALSKLKEIAEIAATRFGLSAIAIVHRLGRVPIAQASIVIGCCSAHRTGALAALPWLMDEIKSEVPIWKREHFADGQTRWVHPQ
jgi:molybdopterin synthase catalytic subunit